MEGRGMGKSEAIFKFKKAFMCGGRREKKPWETGLLSAFSRLGQGRSYLGMGG